MRLHHVAVACASKENADRFYMGVLGLKTIKTQTLNAGLSKEIFGVFTECRMILYGNDDVAIEVFVPPKAPERSPVFGHLCLEVKDRGAFLETCGSAGVAVKKIPKGDSWVVFLADYDGNLFEIKEVPV